MHKDEAFDRFIVKDVVDNPDSPKDILLMMFCRTWQSYARALQNNYQWRSHIVIISGEAIPALQA